MSKSVKCHSEIGGKFIDQNGNMRGETKAIKHNKIIIQFKIIENEKSNNEDKNRK